MMKWIHFYGLDFINILGTPETYGFLKTFIVPELTFLVFTPLFGHYFHL